MRSGRKPNWPIIFSTGPKAAASPMRPLASFINPDNTRSLALAKRLGAVLDREDTIEGDPVLIQRHLGHASPLAQAQYAEVTA